MMVRLEDVLLVLWLAGWALHVWLDRCFSGRPLRTAEHLFWALWPLTLVRALLKIQQEARPWRD